MNSHFGDAFANRFAISKVAILCTVDAGLNASYGLQVFQASEPSVEDFGG